MAVTVDRPGSWAKRSKRTKRFHTAGSKKGILLTNGRGGERKGGGGGVVEKGLGRGCGVSVSVCGVGEGGGGEGVGGSPCVRSHNKEGLRDRRAGALLLTLVASDKKRKGLGGGR